MTRLESIINKKNQFDLVKISVIMHVNKTCSNLYLTEYKSQYLRIIKTSIYTIQLIPEFMNAKKFILDNIEYLNAPSMDKWLSELFKDFTSSSLSVENNRNDGNNIMLSSTNSSHINDNSKSEQTEEDNKNTNDISLDFIPRSSSLNSVTNQHNNTFNAQKYNKITTSNDENYATKIHSSNKITTVDFKPSRIITTISEYLPYVKVSVDFTISNLEIFGIFSKELKR